MKNLLYKEFKLCAHPTVYIFLFLDAMLLIPSYPYYVAFIYTCLGIFFVFLNGRIDKDVTYSVLLPIRKSDVVKARCLMIGAIELMQIILAVPFAFLTHVINPKGNLAGIEANAAFFGFVFIMFAVFNIIFIPMFYKTAYKPGVALVWAGSAVLVYIVIMEAAVQVIAPLKTYLDTSAPGMQIKQIPILIAGIIIFFALLFFSYKKGAANFEKVDL
ncbi:MAG TPA: ABC-2 transporter permease [Ruminiclostridium sp.]|nr:ABC-2 transporter permease [Ruminiclostridium sp.]